MPNEAIKPVRWPFPPHLAGGPHCDAAETTWANVPHADRLCKADADCTLVTGNGNCFNAALNRSGAKKPGYAQMPCGNPASGACAPQGSTARCIDGCCSAGSGP